MNLPLEPRTAQLVALVAVAHGIALVLLARVTPAALPPALEPQRLSAALIAPAPVPMRSAPAASATAPTRVAPRPIERPAERVPEPTRAPPAAVAPAVKAVPTVAAERTPDASADKAVPGESAASKTETAVDKGAAAAAAARASGKPGNEAVTPPHADASHLGNPSPRYPATSRRLGERGEVQLELLVCADGTVGEVRVARSSGYPRLDAAATEAARAWRFVPARRGDTPIDYWYLQSVRFALDAA